MSRRAVVTEAQIKRMLRAANALFPYTGWMATLKPDGSVIVEPAKESQGSPPEPKVDEDSELVL